MAPAARAGGFGVPEPATHHVVGQAVEHEVAVGVHAQQAGFAAHALACVQHQRAGVVEDVEGVAGLPIALGAAVVVVEPDDRLPGRTLGGDERLVVLALGRHGEAVLGTEARAGHAPHAPRIRGRAHRPASVEGVFAGEAVELRAVVVVPARVGRVRRAVFAAEIVGFVDVPTPDGGRPTAVVFVEKLEVDDVGPRRKQVADVGISDRAARGFPHAAQSAEAGIDEPVPVGVARAAAFVPDHHVLARGEHIGLGEAARDVPAAAAGVDAAADAGHHLAVGLAVLALHVVFDVEHDHLVDAVRGAEPGGDLVEALREVAVVHAAADVVCGAVAQQQTVGEVEGAFGLGGPVHVELERPHPHAELIEDRVHLIGVDVAGERRVDARVEAVVGADEVGVGERFVEVEQTLGGKRLPRPAGVEVVDAVCARRHRRGVNQADGRAPKRCDAHRAMHPGSPRRFHRLVPRRNKPPPGTGGRGGGSGSIERAPQPRFKPSSAGAAQAPRARWRATRRCPVRGR